MKKISKLLVLLTMVFCLSGCMKMNVEMTVKSSKELDMKMDILTKEEYLTLAGTTQDKMIKDMQDKMGTTSAQVKVTPKTETIDNAKWVGVTASGPIAEKDIKGIVTEKEIDGKKSIVVTLEKDFMSGSQFGGMDPNSIAGQSGQSLDKLKALGMEMKLTINMPADAKSNIGKVEGNKVVIDLLELSAKGSTVQKIEISSALSGGFDMTFVLIGVGVVALIGIVFVMMKKKKKSDTEEVYENSGEPTETEMETSQQVVEPTETSQEVVEPVQEAVEKPEEEVTKEVEETAPVSTEEVVETQDDAKYCPNCGEKVSEDDAFCQKCGFDLKK